MGVQGLWELLAPVGRRVSVETLAGKKLAIDASIWMVQFIKAMRDEKGEMVRNAHLIGFFRRICKLLYLRTKPVFVFDGGTPALKRRTVAARRRHRDNARAKIRKMAEKLLISHLKKKRLEELAEEIRHGGEKGDSKGKKVLSDGVGVEGSSTGPSDDRGRLGASMESLDELLAKSLAAEGGTAVFGGSEAVETGRDGSYDEEENDSDDEEMILPIGSGNIDPAVLVSLPPSMQLDLLVQMREKVMAENRQKYQKIKKAPSKFSELQIQSYLKTVAFRREIDEVQKSAAGRGLGGVQSSRIASEANREFIFSSSFTGDKQVFTSKELPKDGYGDKCPSDKPTTASVSCSTITFQTKPSKEASIGQLMKEVAPDVETYCDERGRVRVNRVRGLGIHMTRDLQRNLDLMKEYELENTCADSNKDPKTMNSKGVSVVPEDASEAGHESSVAVATNENHRTVSTRTEPFNPDLNSSEQSVMECKDTIQISFLEDDSEMIDADDDIFLELASGSSKTDLPMQAVHLNRVTSDSEIECDWEEGPVLQNVDKYTGPDGQTAADRNYDNKEKQTSLSEANNNEGDDVEWEEGDCQNFTAKPGQQDDPGELVSIGLLEEEAEIQEAIKRSLADFKQQSFPTSVNSTSKSTEDQSHTFLDRPMNLADSDAWLENNLDRSPLLPPTGISSQKSALQTPGSSNKQFDPSSSYAVSLDMESSAKNEIIYEESPVTSQTTNGLVKLVDDSLHQKEQFGVTVNLKNESHQKVGPLDSPLCLKEQSDVAVSVSTESCSGVNQNSTSGCQKEQFDVRETVCSDSFGITSNVCIPSRNCVIDAPADAKHDDEASMSTVLAGSGYLGTAGNSYMANFEEEQQQTVEKNDIILDDNRVQSRTQMILDNEMEAQTAKLEEEISLLGQECADLGNEQRKLERNAESVSSEMFAECQELLQMFGLPYIIAPMEAEAQCAYMETKNLVNGVVTDDSDVFLFGARSVYKNIFDDRKYVETYFMKDIESELGLTREKLVHVAMLLGSDYTEGVSGIGIVNAIEVVHAFPEEDGLQKFREWVESPDPTILGKFDSKMKTIKEKNGDDMTSNLEENTSAATDSRDNQTSASSGKVKATFMSKHRNMSKNWHIPPSFPSELVINAYRSPQVDESTETFSWGKPDLPLLRKLCWEKFGWTNKKADELLIPVLEEYNKRETQLRLEAFYTFNERFAKIRSQRIKKALKGITGNLSSDLVSDHAEDVSSDRKSRSASPSKVKQSEPPSSSIKRKKGKCVTENSSHQKNKRQKVNIDVVDCHEDDGTLSGAKIKGRRGRGRGSRRGGGRGNRVCSDNSRAKLNSESTDASLSDDSDVIGQTEDQTEVVPEVRRSSRKRMQVNYAEDAEPDKSKDSLDQIRRNDPEEVAEQQKLVEDDRHEDSLALDRGLDQFPDASSSKDYLFSGGGFCADEDDEQSNAVQQMDGEPLVNDCSYSVDETDKQTDAVQPSSSPTDITAQSTVAPKFNEPDMITVSQDTSSSLNVKAKHALSAMPTLRRKRRKL